MLLHDLIPAGSIGVIYARYSTKKQEKEMQMGTVERVRDKHGWTATELYFDPGVSATKVPLNKRPDLNRLFRDAKAGRFQFILTYSRDRLARDATEHQQIRVEMAKLGIPIVLCNKETIYDTGDLIGQLVQDGYTQFEAEQIRSRTRDMVRTRAQKGEWFSGPPPYGYSFNERTQRYEPSPEAVILVKEMFTAYLRGLSFEDIASGLPIEQNHGRKWTKERVRSIITNPFYAGKTRVFKSDRKSPNSILPKEKWVTGDSAKIVPIINLAEWEHCWHLFEQKRHGEIPPRTFSTPNLLKGILFCRHSDTELSPMNPKNYSNRSASGKQYSGRMYVCSDPNCRCRVIAKDTEEVVIREVDTVIQRRRENIQDGIRTELKKELERLEEEIQSLKFANEEKERLISRASDEMKFFSEVENKADGDALRMVMQQYRLELKQQMKSNRDLMTEKKHRIEYIQNVELKSDTWSDLASQIDGVQNMRRLLLYILKQVIVDVHGKVEVVARVGI